MLFRTPCGGFVAVPDDVLSDYTADQITLQLEAPWVAESIKRLGKGERFIVHLDVR